MILCAWPTSFPGSLILPSPGASEHWERGWRLATLFNVLLTGISLHTGLLIGANISGIGQSTGLFFSSAPRRRRFCLRLPFDDRL